MKKIGKAGLLAVAALTALSVHLTCQIRSAAAVQAAIPYARTVSLTGTQKFMFRLYSAATAGNIVWSEQRSIPITNSTLSHNLGSVNSLFSLDLSQQYWLAVYYHNGATWAKLGAREKLVMPITYSINESDGGGRTVSNVGSVRFVVVLDGTVVLDKETGYLWEREPSNTLVQYHGVCNERSIAGRIGWEGADQSVLQYLIDTNAGSPAISTGHPFVLGTDLRFLGRKDGGQCYDTYIDFSDGTMKFQWYESCPGYPHRVWCYRKPSM